MVYESKQLLPARGQLKINIIFTKPNGAKYVETGFSQSENVKNNYRQMFEEAVLNALFKLNYRIGNLIFNPQDYKEDLSEYIKNVKITSYKFNYFEMGIYSFKRENINGQYKYIVKKKGKRVTKLRPEYIGEKELDAISKEQV